MTTDLLRHSEMAMTGDAEQRVVGRAGEALGLRLLSCERVSAGRTSVFRVCLLNEDRDMSPETTSRFPTGHFVAAARHTRDLGAESFTHRVVHALSARGVRVVGPLHPEPVQIEHAGAVAFWPWLVACRPPGDLLSAGEWGALTGHLHAHGTVQARKIPATSVPPFDALRAFAPRLRRARELAEQPGHPLSGREDLLRSFDVALGEAADVALSASAAAPVVLVHGDNQPGNVLRTPDGVAVMADFERMVFGPAGLDWSALLLSRWHYGFTARDSQAFHAGYASASAVHDHDAALAAAAPFARLRELSGVLVAMLNSGDSGQWEREFHVRRHSIANPGYGPSWTFIGDPYGMQLSHEKRAR